MSMIAERRGILSARQARFRALDVVATMKLLTKLSRHIVSATTIPILVREAVRLEKRPGPVHWNLSEYIAAERCEDVALIATHVLNLPVGGAEAFDRAARLIIATRQVLVMQGAAASRRRSTSDLAQISLRTQIPYLTTQIAKGTVPGGTELYTVTAVPPDRDYVGEVIDPADLTITIGDDNVEKPPSIMGADVLQVMHICYQPASAAQVYFPQTEVVGDIVLSLRLVVDRVDGRIPNVGALLPLRERTLNRIAARATEDRFTPQRPSNEDHRTVQEILDEADPICSRTQVLANNIWILIVCTAFLVAFVWIF
jgi:acetolactate synthase-1/2/3 large subunit